jgi:hypothetical protein
MARDGLLRRTGILGQKIALGEREKLGYEIGFERALLD